MLKIISNLTRIFLLISLICSILIPYYYQSIDVKHLRFRLIHSFLSLKYRMKLDVDRPNLSSDYRAFEQIMLMKPLGNLAEPIDPQDFIGSLRRGFNSMSSLVPKSLTCQIRHESFEDDQQHQLETYWIDDHQKTIDQFKDRLIIYLHGGGFIVGDIQSYAGIECHLSRLFNLTLLHLEYRRSPEHPLPAAVHDALTLYRSLLEQNYSSSQILFMGDSAGGGLALLTIQSIIEQQFDKPRGVITLSPWTDLSASGESYRRNREKDVMFTDSNANDDSIVKLLLGENPLNLTSNDPMISPLFGSFKDFPPMFINVGTAEVLEDDSRRLFEKVREENIDVTFEEGEHLMHIYPIFYLYYPEARQTLNRIRNWIDNKMLNF